MPPQFGNQFQEVIEKVMSTDDSGSRSIATDEGCCKVTVWSGAGLPFRGGIPEGGAIPQHFLAKLLIVDLIERIDVGVSLPSERDLAVKFGMARGTIRCAAEELIMEGKIDRKHGKGTFVAPPKVAISITSNGVNEDELPPVERARLSLSSDKLVSDRKLADDLEIRAGSSVAHIEQLITGAGSPIGLESTYIPSVLFHVGDKQRSVAMSVQRRLREQCKVSAFRIDSTIESVHVAPREAKLLEAVPGLPALLIGQAWYDDGSRLVARSRTVYRADRVIVTSDVTVSS
jgi:GntR family transcriptional regulator